MEHSNVFTLPDEDGRPVGARVASTLVVFRPSNSGSKAFDGDKYVGFHFLPNIASDLLRDIDIRIDHENMRTYHGSTIGRVSD